jgi:hypothetical protein
MMQTSTVVLLLAANLFLFTVSAARAAEVKERHVILSVALINKARFIELGLTEGEEIFVSVSSSAVHAIAVRG